MKRIGIIILIILNFLGCVPVTKTPEIKYPDISGVYHRVEKGQTLWTISKLYNIELDKLAAINQISNFKKIEIGQLIFIPNKPGKNEIVPVVSKEKNPEDFFWPMFGQIVTGFGEIFNNSVSKGINIQAKTHSNVYASRSGKVIFYSPNFSGFGKTIIIEHQDGLVTIYANVTEVFVKPGDIVQRGMTIAKVSKQAQIPGSYLHFEIRKGHIPQNPIFFLPGN